jgi:5-methylcytosine-specific restriction endonuclease McrA
MCSKSVEIFEVGSRMAQGRYKKKNIPYWLKKLVTVRDGCTCQICGKSGLNDIGSGLAYEMVKVGDYDRSWLAPRRFEYDHIIPESKGGLTTPENIRLACRKCNRSKGASYGA